jgi:hypothetical protein
MRTYVNMKIKSGNNQINAQANDREDSSQQEQLCRPHNTVPRHAERMRRKVGRTEWTLRIAASDLRLLASRGQSAMH